MHISGSMRATTCCLKAQKISHNHDKQPVLPVVQIIVSSNGIQCLSNDFLNSWYLLIWLDSRAIGLATVVTKKVSVLGVLFGYQFPFLFDVRTEIRQSFANDILHRHHRFTLVSPGSGW